MDRLSWRRWSSLAASLAPGRSGKPDVELSLEIGWLWCHQAGRSRASRNGRATGGCKGTTGRVCAVGACCRWVILCGRLSTSFPAILLVVAFGLILPASPQGTQHHDQNHYDDRSNQYDSTKWGGDKGSYVRVGNAKICRVTERKTIVTVTVAVGHSHYVRTYASTQARHFRKRMSV